ncbi:cupin domain-containing protein [Sphingorhabdus sp. Alg239-R122]|uniref:cupin domain-containing protein n=1 Tax=Sphingorhabdus sp. Alg239-R122 TaxID=2305989 RepID=UPI0013DC717D|nr:cupin domain-containing protein [Sphingorhabdus sp. Alg239-R122]
MQLQDFDIDVFLRDHWQKKPMLIKNAWPSWDNPITPDELAGLACEPQIESRLITKTGEAWNVENGPLPEARFGELEAKDWALLVQAADHYVPAVAALIEPFRFIPNWRIDDVMVSYAADGGGVGPHYDQYDVFLIQGLGKRRWQVGEICNSDTPMLPNSDLRQLAEFQPTQEWILEPGDILYVPPRIPHNGTAIGDDCMTYSIGFRAPSRAELIADYCDDLLEHLDDDDRYSDTGLKLQSNPGEIPAAAIEQLHTMLTEKINDRETFVRWFGAYNSTRKYPDMDWTPEEPLQSGQVHNILANGACLLRNPASRFSFIRHEGNSVSLFADGDCYDCTDETTALAEQICSQEIVYVDSELTASQQTIALIAKLYNKGSLALDDGE